MAIGFEQDETFPSLASGRAIDAEPGAEDHATGGSPEDIVRRLMDTEADGPSPVAPALPRAAPAKASGKSSDWARHTATLVRRLTAAPRRVINNAYTKARAVMCRREVIWL